MLFLTRLHGGTIKLDFTETNERVNDQIYPVIPSKPMRPPSCQGKDQRLDAASLRWFHALVDCSFLPPVTLIPLA